MMFSGFSISNITKLPNLEHPKNLKGDLTFATQVNSKQSYIRQFYTVRVG